MPANKVHEPISNVRSCNRESRADRAMLIPPPGAKPTADDLHRAVRMLLLCNSKEQRQIVGRRLYHRLDFSTIADQLNITSPRATEIFSSLARRLALAEIRYANDGKNRQTDKKKGK